MTANLTVYDSAARAQHHCPSFGSFGTSDPPSARCPSKVSILSKPGLNRNESTNLMPIRLLVQCELHPGLAVPRESLDTTCAVLCKLRYNSVPASQNTLTRICWQMAPFAIATATLSSQHAQPFQTHHAQPTGFRYASFRSHSNPSNDQKNGASMTNSQPVIFSF
jgi:hypothetical protein